MQWTRYRSNLNRTCINQNRQTHGWSTSGISAVISPPLTRLWYQKSADVVDSCCNKSISPQWLTASNMSLNWKFTVFTSTSLIFITYWKQHQLGIYHLMATQKCAHQSFYVQIPNEIRSVRHREKENKKICQTANKWDIQLLAKLHNNKSQLLQTKHTMFCFVANL